VETARAAESTLMLKERGRSTPYARFSDRRGVALTSGRLLGVGMVLQREGEKGRVWLGVAEYERAGAHGGCAEPAWTKTY
jgi:hypothetical protein